MLYWGQAQMSHEIIEIQTTGGFKPQQIKVLSIFLFDIYHIYKPEKNIIEEARHASLPVTFRISSIKCSML